MTPETIFPLRTLIAWIAAAVLLLALSLLFMLRGESTQTVGPSSFSSSAIGHAGIAELLAQRGVTTLKSQSDSLHKAGDDGVLVLAEPRIRDPNDAALRALLEAPVVLLVLPKWHGEADQSHPAWIEAASPVSPWLSQVILDHATNMAEVVQPELKDAKNTPQWRPNPLGPDPHLTSPAQLLQPRPGVVPPPALKHTKFVGPPAIAPVIASDQGILLGEISTEDRRLWVLADPDVIANHGLAAGNAALALAIFDALRDGGKVVFDETIHGFVSVPANPLQLLSRPAFAAIAGLAGVALALLLWAGMGRFGAPEIAPAPLKAGKTDLVQNVARLFRYAGYQDVLVRRYVEETIRDVGRRLHAPGNLNDAGLVKWLAGGANTRGVTVDAHDIMAQAAMLTVSVRQPTADLFRLARAIFGWKQEMLDGTGGGAGERGGDPRRNPPRRGGPG